MSILSLRTVAIVLLAGVLDGATAFWIHWWCIPLGIVVGLIVGYLCAKWDIRDDDREFRERTDAMFRRWDS